MKPKLFPINLYFSISGVKSLKVIAYTLGHVISYETLNCYVSTRPNYSTICPIFFLTVSSQTTESLKKELIHNL